MRFIYSFILACIVCLFELIFCLISVRFGFHLYFNSIFLSLIYILNLSITRFKIYLFIYISTCCMFFCYDHLLSFIIERKGKKRKHFWCIRNELKLNNLYHRRGRKSLKEIKGTKGFNAIARKFTETTAIQGQNEQNNEIK